MSYSAEFLLTLGVALSVSSSAFAQAEAPAEGTAGGESSAVEDVPVEAPAASEASPTTGGETNPSEQPGVEGMPPTSNAVGEEGADASPELEGVEPEASPTDPAGVPMLDSETATEIDAPDEYEAPERKALILHAEAIASESRGDTDEALRQLREAYALTPNSERVRFDLARVALLYGGERSDLRPYYDAPRIPDPGAQALYAAVANQLETSLKVSGKDQLLTGSLRLGVTVDDNVAISPTDPGEFTSGTGGPTPALNIPDPQTGVRSILDGLVLVRPLNDSILTVEGVAGFRFGTFLNSEDGQVFENQNDAGNTESTVQAPDLGIYDSQRLFAGARASSELAGFLFRGAIGGNLVFFDGFSNFSQSLNLGVETLLGDASDHIGFYGDFIANNFSEDAHPEGTEFDRDGSILGGGLAFAINRDGVLGFSARLGLFDESTDGEDLQVRGARLDFVFTSNAGPVSLAAGSGNQLRVYGDVSFSDITEDALNARVDGLIQPFARVLVGITDELGVYGNYGYTRNLSTDDDNIAPSGRGRLLLDRRYTRSFFEFGVEGRL